MAVVAVVRNITAANASTTVTISLIAPSLIPGGKTPAEARTTYIASNKPDQMVLDCHHGLTFSILLFFLCWSPVWV